MLMFLSGSCRLYRPLYLFAEKYNINVIQGIPKYFGDRSFGYLHDTKCHIQFLNFIRGNIELPEDVLPRFFTTYTIIHYPPPKIETDNPPKIPRLKREIKNCKIFCLEDLDTLVKLCGEDALIFFQCHFRPQIIFDDVSKEIPNRELIFQTLSEFVVGKENIFLVDPSFNEQECYDFDIDDKYDYLSDHGYEIVKKEYEKYIDKFYNLPLRDTEIPDILSHPVE